MAKKVSYSYFSDHIGSNIKNGFFGGAIDQKVLEEILGEKNVKENEKRIEYLKKKLIQPGNKPVLPVLGAGVSIPAGIPTWDQLLNNMWYRQIEIDLIYSGNGGEALTVEQEQLLEFIRAQTIVPPHSDDLLEYAQYFRHILTNDRGYESIATAEEKELYLNKQFIQRIEKGLTHAIPDADKSVKWNQQNIKRQRNRILGLIGRLVYKYKLNVITYNFDDLLEAYLKATYTKLSFKYIQDAREMYQEWDTRTCKIYHVHGCIPLTNYSGVRQSEKVIFAECDYLHAEQYAYDWLNAVQAERIHRKNLMIVGFSAQDYNFKRILRNLSPLTSQALKSDPLKDEGARSHFIFLPLEDFLKGIQLPDEVKPEDIVWKEHIIWMLRRFMEYKNKYLREYGIYPIWTSHEALPDMLKSLL